MTIFRKRLARRIGIAAVTGIGLYAFFWWFGAGYVLSVVTTGEKWPSMSVRDLRLSHAMRRALETPPPAVHAGALAWHETEPGFEIAELPVLTDEEEIDRFYLARIDPARFAFSVRVGGGRYHSIRDWETALPDAALLVNGSFFGTHNEPDTPVMAGGQPMGPQTYDAKAGAFVAAGDGAHLVDLSTGADWKTELSGAHDAMIAYPLLIGADGQSHVTSTSRWLSNRTFVGEDKNGRIVIGSTKEAFFSLDREAEFLRTALPDLKIALNLDGGPVACQSVRSGAVHRLHIASWEAQVHGDRVSVLHWQVGLSDMPVVFAVTRKATQNQAALYFGADAFSSSAR